VNVEREKTKAKFWLEPVRLEKSRGFGRAEIGRIERPVAENAAFLVEVVACVLRELSSGEHWHRLSV